MDAPFAKIERVNPAAVPLAPITQERANILIVDDRPDKRLVFRTILDELGENLVTADSGEEALRWLLENECAVILLDVNMPGMDGLETAELIRSRRKSAHTPIIFITAFADEIHTAKGYSLGAVDYILSPVMPNVLCSKVRALVQLYKLNVELKKRADERVALAREQAARYMAEQSQRRAAFLAELARVMGSSLDVGSILKGASWLVVPFLADYCSITVIGPEGRIRETRSAMVPNWGQQTGCEGPLFEEALAGLQARVLTSRTRAIHPPGPIDPAVPGVPRGELAAFPLIARSATLGVLFLGRSAALDPFSRDDIDLAESIAERVAGTIDNSLLFAKLQEADRRKTEFLATLSHELRNPLAPMRTALHAMRVLNPPDAGRVAQLRDMMDRQVTHMTRLVEDLLDVSRITSGNIELRKQRLDVASEVGQALESCQSRIASAGHKVTLTLPDQPVFVDADHTRFQQMLENLLINAAKYTEAGGSIDISAAAENGDAVIRIRDNGIGIAPEQMPHIWGLFVQVDESPERTRRGLGIGLALVQDLAARHGGSVDAKSEGLGKGSEFTLRIPLASQLAVTQFDDDAKEAADMPDKPLRVLIVDDNVDAAESFRTMLDLLGQETAIAHDGGAAIDVAMSFKPELVFLDIGMPVMSGTEVAKRLRKDASLNGVYLVALSGYGTEQDRAKSIASGFDEHRTKPLDPDLLPGILRTAQERKA
jgi:signal transduction histidine kinase